MSREDGEEDHIISSDDVKTRQTAATLGPDEYTRSKDTESSKNQKAPLQALKLSSQNHSSKSLKNVKTVEYQLDEDEEEDEVSDFDQHKEE